MLPGLSEETYTEGSTKQDCSYLSYAKQLLYHEIMGRYFIDAKSCFLDFCLLGKSGFSQRDL
jgi:hypothetical protein